MLYFTRVLSNFKVYFHTKQNNVGQNGSAAMVATNRPSGVAPEMNMRNPLHTGDESCMEWNPHSFETHSRRHQKSKRSASVTPQKRLVSSNLKNKFSQKSLHISICERRRIRISSGCEHTLRISFVPLMNLAPCRL